MKISNKKIKAIKRLAGEKTPQDIAEELNLNIKDVEKVLGIGKSKPHRETTPAIDHIFHWLLLAIVFLAPFMHLKKIYDFANLPQLGFIQIGVVFLLFLWLIRGIITGQFVILKSPFNLPILLFLLWALGSLLYAHNKYEGFLPWMHWAASGLMFFLVAGSFDDDKRRRRLLIAIFASGFFVSMLGISQHLFKVTWVPQVVSPASTFANRNMAVHFVILSLPLAPALILTSRNRIWNWTLFLCASLMLTYLIYCETRAGWASFAVQVVLFVGLIVREFFVGKDLSFWDKNKTVATAVALGVFVILVNFGPTGFQMRFGQVIQRTATVTTFDQAKFEEQDVGDRSIGLRYAIWRNTLEMIKDHPLKGLGLGNHKLFYPLYHRKVVREREFSETAQLSHVHNDYLQAFAEVGVIGMIFLGWIVAAFFRVGFRLTSSQTPRHVRILTMGIAVGIIGLAVNAAFSFPMQRSIPPFILMIYLAILASLYAGKDRRLLGFGQKGVMFSIAVMTLIVWFLLIQFYYRGILCDRHFLKVTQLEKLRQWRSLIVEGKKAFNYNPHRIKTMSYIGRAHIEMGEHRKGIEALKKVIAAYPNHMNALLNLGVAYGSIGEHAEALKIYDKVLSIKPDYHKAHNNMANIYMKQKKYDKALEKFKIASQYDPENSIIHFNVGIVQMKLKKFPEAAESFKRTAELKPNWDLAHKNLGIVYFQFLGKRKEGLEHLKKALELNPKIRDAAQIKKLMTTFKMYTPTQKK